MKVVLAIVLLIALVWSQDTAPAGSYYCFNYQRRCKGESLDSDGTDDLYKLPEYLYKGETQKVDDGYVLSYIYNKEAEKNETADTGDDGKDDNNGGYTKRHVFQDDDAEDDKEKLSCTPYEIGFSLHYDAYKAWEAYTDENLHLDLATSEYGYKYGYWHQGVEYYPTGYGDSYNYKTVEFRFYYYDKYNLAKIRSDDTTCPGSNAASVLPAEYAPLDSGCEEKYGAKYWKPSAENVTTAYNNTIVYGVYNDALTYIAITFSYDYLEYVKNLGDSVAYYTWDIDQPANYGDLKWYPLKYSLYYIPTCNQYLVKLYDWKQV